MVLLYYACVLQEGGCGLFTNLALFVSDNGESVRGLLSSGAVEVSAAALKRHPDHEGVQVRTVDSACVARFRTRLLMGSQPRCTVRDETCDQHIQGG